MINNPITNNLVEQVKTYIRTNFMRYGFFPFLYLMDEYEKEGKYELCGCIYDVIKEKSDKFDMDIPTKFNDEAREIFIMAFRSSSSRGNIALENMPFYANEIREHINKLLCK